MADVLTSDQRHYCMSQIRGKDTTPELLLRKAVWASGIRYRLHRRIGQARPDIVFVGPKVAVFVDGCFWHCCPKHCKMPETNREFWKQKLYRNAERDKELTLKLKKSGWKVIRFWEHQIKDDLASCVNLVVETVDESRFDN